MADFFKTRDAIKAKLEQDLDGIRRYYFAEDLDGVKETSQIKPAIHILFAGYQPASAERHRVDITIDQTWAVVLVVQQRSGEYSGGQYLDQIVRSLHGYKPGEEMLALELATAPFSPSYRPGVAYYPLAFSTRIINRKGA